MPFFRDLHIFTIYKSKTHTKNKPSLRELMPENLIYKISSCLHMDSQKRVSSFISSKSYKASMTVEAALVMPIFLFAVLSLLSIFQIMKIKSCMDVAVMEAGNEYCVKQYGANSADLIMPVSVQKNINDFLEKNLSKSEKERLGQKILVTDISYGEEKNIVSFRVDYEVSTDFGLPGLDNVKLFTSYYGHKWCGYVSKEEKGRMVFISNTQEVYHLNKNCSYLNVTVQKVPYSNLTYYRNGNGSKYVSCDFCNKLAYGGSVYITPEGRNYHNTETCIGLTRHIYTVLLSSVKNKKPCSGCGEENG